MDVTTPENYRKLDSYTKWCLQTYAQLLKAEKRAEKLRVECDDMVHGIPKRDMALYVEITTEMEDNMEKWGSPRAPQPKGV
jgi:hypothetical protein